MEDLTKICIKVCILFRNKINPVTLTLDADIIQSIQMMILEQILFAYETYYTFTFLKSNPTMTWLSVCKKQETIVRTQIKDA